MLAQARNVEELDELVTTRYGSDHVPAARLAAVLLHGAKWVFGTEPTSQSNLAKIWRALLRPTNAVLLSGCAAAIFAFVWPPYTVTLQPGLSVHVGFFSIFSESASARHGAVNVSLLSLELLAVAALTAAGFFVAQRVESAWN